jgi:hypothetical protein
MTGNPDMPDNILMSEEAHFHLHGAINMQNFQYWATENLHEFRECPLYNPKVTIWCVALSTVTTGPSSSKMKMGKLLQLHHMATTP